MGQLHQRFESGNTIVEGDNNGEQAAYKQIKLSGCQILTASGIYL